MKEFIDKLIDRLEEQKGKENDYSSIEGKKLVRHWNNCVDVCKEIVNQLAEEYKVSEMPTGWIPCSERLPIQNEKVLCTYIFNNNHDRKYVQVLDYYATDEKPHFQHEGYEGLEVIAWMPLPAPYTEGE